MTTSARHHVKQDQSEKTILICMICLEFLGLHFRFLVCDTSLLLRLWLAIQNGNLSLVKMHWKNNVFSFFCRHEACAKNLMNLIWWAYRISGSNIQSILFPRGSFHFITRVLKLSSQLEHKTKYAPNLNLKKKSDRKAIALKYWKLKESIWKFTFLVPLLVFPLI